MTITYKWTITSLKVRNIDDSRIDAVVQTHWSKVGTDENGNEGVYHGATMFTIDPNEDFIPFEQLTEETIFDWVKSNISDSFQEIMDKEIQEQIYRKVNPITEKTLPWAT